MMYKPGLAHPPGWNQCHMVPVCKQRGEPPCIFHSVAEIVRAVIAVCKERIFHAARIYLTWCKVNESLLIIQICVTLLCIIKKNHIPHTMMGCQLDRIVDVELLRPCGVEESFHDIWIILCKGTNLFVISLLFLHLFLKNDYLCARINKPTAIWTPRRPAREEESVYI